MILDARLEFSDAQALTASAASTNVIDLGDEREFLGVDGDLFVNVVVNTAFTDNSGHDGTLVVTLQSHEDAEFGGTATVLQSRTFVIEELTAGRVLCSWVLPAYLRDYGAQGVSDLEARYLRMYYTVANMTCTGAIDAWIGTEKASQSRRVVN